MVTRQVPKESHVEPPPPDTTRFVALCTLCHRTDGWPIGLYEKTAGTCARCLEARPDLLMVLVAAEGRRSHPYRDAPVLGRVLRWGVRYPVAAWSSVVGWSLGAALGGLVSGQRRNVCLAMLALLLVWLLVFVRRVPR